MIAQRITNDRMPKDDVVQQATHLLKRQQLKHSTHTLVQRWVCEVCGMPHIGTAPTQCDSCGVTNALVPQQDLRSEIGSRW